MNDDKDTAVIQGLFGAGVALGLVALLAFADGDINVALIALAIPLLSLGVGAVYLLTKRRHHTIVTTPAERRTNSPV